MLSDLKCHSTVDWKVVTFDHTTTLFPLVGKHSSVSCSECHKAGGKSVVVTYKGISTKCESCHDDQHAQQFAILGATDCTSCHTPKGWKVLMFDHEAQSSFSLTGAHMKVPCGSCHRAEMISGKVVVRYKPVSKKCESCHGQKDMKNG